MDSPNDEKALKALERRAQREQEQHERDEAIRQIGAYDALTDDYTITIEDIAAWCREYRERLKATHFEGRNAIRNEAMLQTLITLMEEAGTRVFPCSKSFLVLKSGRYARSANEAITDLRLGGYVKRFRPMHKEGEAITALSLAVRYALVMDALAPLPKPAEETAQTVSETLENGDFSHDAFAGRKGLSASRRKVLAALRATSTPVTVSGLARSSGIDRKQIERSLAWLATAELAVRQPNPQAKRNEGDLWTAIEEAQDEAQLDRVVEIHRELAGSTERRMEHSESDWVTVRARRQAIKRKREKSKALEQRMRTRRPVIV